jgi:hypothetical protein
MCTWALASVSQLGLRWLELEFEFCGVDTEDWLLRAAKRAYT